MAQHFQYVWHCCRCETTNTLDSSLFCHRPECRHLTCNICTVEHINVPLIAPTKYVDHNQGHKQAALSKKGKIKERYWNCCHCNWVSNIAEANCENCNHQVCDDCQEHVPNPKPEEEKEKDSHGGSRNHEVGAEEALMDMAIAIQKALAKASAELL